MYTQKCVRILLEIAADYQCGLKVTDQLLFMQRLFVKYLRRNGNAVGQYSNYL
jgi:hypothetical protein